MLAGQAGGGTGARLAIDECVEDVLPVLLDQVVDVAEDAAVPRVVSAVWVCLGVVVAGGEDGALRAMLTT